MMLSGPTGQMRARPPVPFAGASLTLESLSRLAAFRQRTCCLLAQPALAARLSDCDLSPAERDRMQGMRLKRGRDRFLVAHTLVRRVLGCLLERAPARLEMSFGRWGKPFVENSPLHFSLSYAHDWIAVIVTSYGPVGVDVEDGGEGDRDLPVDLVMNPADGFLPIPSTPAERFYTGWTLKEAMSKADGGGLYRAFDAIRLEPLGDNAYRGTVGAEVWHARHCRLEGGTHLAHAGRTLLDPHYVRVG